MCIYFYWVSEPVKHPENSTASLHNDVEINAVNNKRNVKSLRMSSFLYLFLNYYRANVLVVKNWLRIIFTRLSWTPHSSLISSVVRWGNIVRLKFRSSKFLLINEPLGLGLALFDVDLFSLVPSPTTAIALGMLGSWHRPAITSSSADQELRWFVC